MSLKEGTKVEFIASDPWDFVTAVGSGPFEGLVSGVCQDKDSILVKLNEPLVFKDSVAEYLVISPRHQGYPLKGIMKGQEVCCGMMGITKEQAESDDPCDTSWWRGGGIVSTGSIRKAG
ncbi:MAG: hypothetical protein KAS23_16160 [Anaerohalosphaera sp.]|nr:hypothetical protein [Anaerohalosphaera sp.]